MMTSPSTSLPQSLRDVLDALRERNYWLVRGLRVANFSPPPPSPLYYPQENMVGVPQGSSNRGKSSFFLISCGWVRLTPLGTPVTNRPTVPAPDDR
jgi:hypothetical protein